ncbi:RipA family octameric membrane protein [Streptomyces sporangiiformans]|uniref:Small integral membrane protein n=1 Tax=Streptomyces sporangiiformans TaxID=2315329 RepID=A0A505DDS2_9ACTN|nr:hypothetical protein [Streptomyces sporangiiformans]TPQ21884.1 hypothetical protein FGD71_012665 [Streptomyces sporangiiformans]
MTEPEDIAARVWNSSVAEHWQGPEAREHLGTAVLEQYKLCVEMADRVSARRNLNNTFFLSLNSLVATGVVSAGGARADKAPMWLLIAGLVILLTQCAAWFTLIRSYRQLNTAKWAVIGAIEERLPLYAYSRGEWEILGKGSDRRKYVQLSQVEQWVPWIFAASYLCGGIAIAVR